MTNENSTEKYTREVNESDCVLRFLNYGNLLQIKVIYSLKKGKRRHALDQDFLPISSKFLLLGIFNPVSNISEIQDRQINRNLLSQ